MGFELTLRGTRRAPPRQGQNPFTGELELHAPLVMSATEHAAMLTVIGRHGGRLDDCGGGRVVLEKAALFFSGFDEEGGLVKVEGDLRLACVVLFDLAEAGQLVVLPDLGDALVTSRSALERATALEHELGSPTIVVDDAEALAAALSAEYASAAAHTERALRGT